MPDFSFDTLIAAALIGVVTTLIANFQNRFISLIDYAITYIFSKKHIIWKAQEVDISVTRYVSTKGRTKHDDIESKDLILAVSHKVFNLAKPTSVKLFLRATEETEGNPKTNYERKLSRKLEHVPNSEFKFGDMTFRYTESREPGEKNEKITETLLIKSDKMQVSDIIAFVDECHKDYVSNRYKNEIGKQYYILSHRNDSISGIRYNKYEIAFDRCFDDLYFPEKEKIIRHIDDLQSGKISKVSILLHGIPGCGKSSLIKSIGKYTGRNIINVKLSDIKSRNDLFSLFAHQIIYIDNGGTYIRGEYTFMPFENRIYILEDVDAESKIVLERADEAEKIKIKAKSKPKQDVEPDEFTLEFDQDMIDKKSDNNITLSDILNIFDGVYSLTNVIIIMTTNYKSKLDSAFIRPGRITMDVEMRAMTTENAKALMIRKYNDFTSVNDYSITPAELEALCNRSDNIDELRQNIRDFEAKENKEILGRG